MHPDVFQQMAQMSYVTADGSAQGQGPWDQRPINSQWRVKDSEKHVVSGLNG